MKKTLNINLGGIPIIIDDDAYDELDQYIHQLQKHFRNSEGREEILSDIEMRLAEILNENRKDRNIVNMTDVIYAKQVMGTPEDFVAGEESTRTGSGVPFDIQTGKKLFRDPEDKIIGGVCSGLAAYFGIEDPIWVRLAFAIVLLTFGFGLIAYLVLWVVMPVANTAADRLAMMGEPANVKNIARMVESGIGEISDALKDIGQELKKKSSRRRETGDYRTEPFAQRFLTMRNNEDKFL